MPKKISTRIVHKHDLEVNWLKATNFVPMQGELIIYDIEVDAAGNALELPSNRTTPYTYARIKVGDGITSVGTLPFILDNITVNDKSIQDMIKEYVDEAILGGEW